jgi:hypothetical protein
MTIGPNKTLDASTFVNPERCTGPATISDLEVLKLNPNCCYSGCMGCTSVKKLRDFQSRWPTDWMHRLIGSVRLRTEALRIT